MWAHIIRLNTCVCKRWTIDLHLKCMDILLIIVQYKCIFSLNFCTLSLSLLLYPLSMCLLCSTAMWFSHQRFCCFCFLFELLLDALNAYVHPHSLTNKCRHMPSNRFSLIYMHYDSGDQSVRSFTMQTTRYVFVCLLLFFAVWVLNGG